MEGGPQLSPKEQQVWEAVVDVNVNSTDQEILDRTIHNLRKIPILGFKPGQEDAIKKIIEEAGPDYFESVRDSYLKTNARWEAMKEIAKLLS
ncbi:MAG: hypothetical protein WCK48_03590 [bacterium]